MAQREGFAPLAARPAPPLSMASFAVCSLVILLSLAKRFAPAKRLHPQIPLLSGTKKIRIWKNPYSYLWRRERDLNPRIHSCITRFRIVRVQPLRHLCTAFIITYLYKKRNRFLRCFSFFYRGFSPTSAVVTFSPATTI